MWINDHWQNGLALTYPKGKDTSDHSSSLTIFSHVGPYKYAVGNNSDGNNSDQCPLFNKPTTSGHYSFWVYVPKENSSYTNFNTQQSSPLITYPYYKGGKLPGGLCAGACYSGEDRKTISCDEAKTCTSILKKGVQYDGATLRLMWREQGRIAAYYAKMAPYCPMIDNKWGLPDRYFFATESTQPGPDGNIGSSNIDDAKPGIMVAGKWNYFDVHLTLNTCSSDGSCNTDGSFSVYHTSADQPNSVIKTIPSMLIIKKNRIHWRCSAATTISSFIFQTFMGGSEASWRPTRDTTFTYKDFNVYRNK